jgi:hypothetical protein
VAINKGRRRVYIAPLHAKRAAPESEWVAVSDWSRFENQPRWSIDGRLLYFISARDNLRCIWAQPLDPFSKHSIGEPFAVYHFHDTQRELYGLTSVRHRIVFSQREETGSIWLGEPQ